MKGLLPYILVGLLIGLCIAAITVPACCNKRPTVLPAPSVIEEVTVVESRTGAKAKIVIGAKETLKDPTMSREASSGFSGGRHLSWFGQSPIQAVEKRQGFFVDQSGALQFGGSKGYGILEQFWDWVKDVFWFSLFGIGILVVLAFVPATASVARVILRTIAGVIPFLGSIVERARASVVYQKPLEQVVEGGEKFKAAVMLSTLDAVEKTFVIDLFKQCQSSAQDKATQDAVKNAK